LRLISINVVLANSKYLPHVQSILNKPFSRYLTDKITYNQPLGSIALSINWRKLIVDDNYDPFTLKNILKKEIPGISVGIEEMGEIPSQWKKYQTTFFWYFWYYGCYCNWNSRYPPTSLINT